MTTMELKSLKMDLVEELLSLNDKEMLNRVKNYLKRLKKWKLKRRGRNHERRSSSRD